MVQEEILFCIYPELIPFILLCPRLNSNEALLFSGAERFVAHSGNSQRCMLHVHAVHPLCSGYGSSFRCLGMHRGHPFGLPLDTTGVRRESFILAIDALNVSRNPEAQYTLPAVLREIVKCLTGLNGGHWRRRHHSNVVTLNCCPHL